MLGMACFYTPQQHQLLEPPLLDWCRNQTSDEVLKKRLFVYRQLQVGTFVIAQWLDRAKGLFVDTLNLGNSLSNFSREKAQELRRRLLAPVSSSDTKDMMSTVNSNFTHTQQETNEKLSEKNNYNRSTKVSVSMAGRT